MINKRISIASYHRVRTALEGEYSSVFKGRSMDFDDLREYVLGDDIKDIDWKATARSGTVRIRRYVATRKQNVMLVVDTGRSMAATAPNGDSKRDVSVMVSGVLASIVQRHGDLIGMVAGDKERLDHMPLKGSKPHIERMLQSIHTRTSLDGPESDLTKLLDYIRRSIRHRMMLFVITDNLQISAAQEYLFRRLAAQHELFFICVSDLDPSDSRWSNRKLYDISDPVDLPAVIRKKKPIEKAYKTFLDDAHAKARQTLDRIQISSVQIDSADEVMNKIVRLLENHKHARHH